MMRRGFTLAEGLVSLALMGLIAGLLALGIAGAIAFPQRSEARLARIDEVVAAQTLLRARIGALVPGRTFGGSRPLAEVSGRADLFDFAAPAPDGEAPRELLRYRLGLSRDGTLTLWTLSSLSRDPDVRAPGLAGWQARPVLSGVARLSIDYYGSVDGRTRPAWRTAWLSGITPPQLVRVRIAFPPGDARVFPDLIVQPQAQLPAYCRADPATGGCAVAE